jgi:hypothetical protein
LGHDDRRVLVDPPCEPLLELVKHAADRLVVVVVAGGELDHRGIGALRVHDRGGAADEVGDRDERAVGWHATVLPAEAAGLRRYGLERVGAEGGH